MLADRISDAVEDRLRQLHRGERTVYRRELSICVGAGRIDVAAVNGLITGCEVKSARDGLGRLPSQVELYGRVVDTAVLIVERAHPMRAAAHVPEWWGVWRAAEDGADSVELEVVRAAEPNPDVQPFAVAQLLWRNEAFELLRQRGLQRGLSAATRWRLWEVLAAELPLTVLREEVRERLKARRDW